MNNKKIQQLLQELTDFSFFEGQNKETEFIERSFEVWLNEQIQKYQFINDVCDRLDALESIEIPELPFSDNQIKALLALADATLGKKPEAIVEKQEPVEEPSEPTVRKIRRGRKPKIQDASEKQAIEDKSGDDEFMDSPVAMRDPKTGLQMLDSSGKPMFLRVKKNPVKIVVPPNYKPPPPQHVANNMAMQEDGMNMGKAQGFKLPGTNLTFADLINNAKK